MTCSTTAAVWPADRRLSLGVFGAPNMPAAESLADSLGVALQITNILRDIREDYRNGRVYLPAEDLDRFGCTLAPAGPDPAAEPAPDRAAEARFVRLIEFEAARARDWYATGLQLLPMLDGRSAACTGAMAGIYRKLLDRIAAEPAAVLHGRLFADTAGKGDGRRAVAGRPDAGRPRPAGPACRILPGGLRLARRRAAPVSTGSLTTLRRVVVIGGGLAGITAAIALAEAGAAVTLLEARPRLGGATTSFNRGALVVDTGQHVFLRCCTAYRGLLTRLGMTGSVRIQDRFDVTVLSPDGAARLRRNALPGPLHMGAALARYPRLSLAERARVPRAALAMRMLNPADPALDQQRLGDWLAAHGQDERARRVLWDLFTVSSLNIPGDDASLALAATVVKTALLGKKDAADIGVPLAPLGELHGTAWPPCCAAWAPRSGWASRRPR